MKLAEALTQRSDIQKRIAQLRERLAANAKVQEGDTPAEDPAKLLEELGGCVGQYRELISRINRTNTETRVDGVTLTDMIAQKDAMSLHISVLRDFLAQASEKVDRYSKTEIKILSTVDVPALQRQLDDMSRQLRELDCALQAANWSTELK